MSHWSFHSVVYHIYPLGLCGAPARNDFVSPPVPRLEKLVPWGLHARALGANTIYLGPLFESTTHGYDTADYFHLDRRLGTDDLLKKTMNELHAQGHRIIFDGVFHHVGRDFWAFRDVCRLGEQSDYCNWFHGLRFGQSSPLGDIFTYETWQGHYDLVKLDLANPEVKKHLFEAAAAWIREYDIDGLRLDAADCMDLDFLAELAAWCKSIKPDFWLFGEIVHGDYRKWAGPGKLDAATNYEAYKGLYSSLNDKNYFEIAYALNRQFGGNGIYAGLPMYNFVDNHDVNRVASRLDQPRFLYPLYCLLFTMPGVPSVYYGSEWGLSAEKGQDTDAPLRPALTLEAARHTTLHPDLEKTVCRLATLRREHAALQTGTYRQVYISHEQLGFIRSTAEEKIMVLMNASEQAARVEIKIPEWARKKAEDILNPGEKVDLRPEKTAIEIPPNWARVLKID